METVFDGERNMEPDGCTFVLPMCRKHGSGINHETGMKPLFFVFVFGMYMRPCKILEIMLSRLRERGDATATSHLRYGKRPDEKLLR